MVQWKEFERHNNNGCSLPKFSFLLEEAEVIAVKCEQKIIHEMFMVISGKTKDFNGEFLFGERKDIFWIRKEDGLYEDFTVKEYLSLFFHLHSQNRNPEINQIWKELKERFFLSDLWKKKIKTLSSQQKRRIHLARTILLQPKVLFIEETLGGIDEEEMERYRKSLMYIKEKKIAVILFTSILEHALFITEMVYLYDADGFHPLEREESNKYIVPENMEVVPKISCKRNEQNYFFSPNEIDYIEAVKGKSCIYAGGEAYTAAVSLGELEEKMYPYGFFRCHRSYLVNMEKIREITCYARGSYLIRLNRDNGEEIPLSRAKVEELKAQLQL